jgi:hypothetical protein
MLAAIYGNCRVNQSFPWPALPRDYANTAIGELLERIQSELANFRDHRGFIRSARVPPCDYFVSDPPFILEFDESQHFTRPRSITLALYPADLPLGFSPSRWRKLCLEINAVDDQPFDRDERRAWYDTLRDLAPSVYGFRPTARLYAGECPWCSLDASSSRDLEVFFNLLGRRVAAGKSSAEE